MAPTDDISVADDCFSSIEGEDIVLIPYTAKNNREDRTLKHPQIKCWQKFTKKYAHDELIKQRKEGKYNFGIRADNLFICDFDLKDSKAKKKNGDPVITKEEAIKKFEELKKLFPEMMKTRIHKTPTGGFHFIFKLGEWGLCTQAIEGYIDLKCGPEGQVVGCGSTIDKTNDYPGGQYTIVNPGPIQQIPAKLEDYIREKYEAKRNARKTQHKLKKNKTKLWTANSNGDGTHKNYDEIKKLIYGHKLFSHLKHNPTYIMGIKPKSQGNGFSIDWGTLCCMRTHHHQSAGQCNIWITRNRCKLDSHNSAELIDRETNLMLVDRQFCKNLQVLLFGDRWKLAYADTFDTFYITQKCFQVEDSYKIMKQYFEYYVMKLMNPLSFMKHDKKEIFNHVTGRSEGKKNIYQFYKTDSNLKQAFAELKWWEEIPNEDGTTTWWNDGKHGGGSFICRWLNDANKRVYQGLEFSPSHYEPPGYFNQFKGLRINQIYADNPNDCSYDKADKKKWLKVWNQFRHLFETDREWEVAETWIANVCCFPQIRTKICLILQSYQQQIGKGSLVEFIRKVIGDEVFYKSNNSKSIVGVYSHAMRNSLFVNFDEVEYGSKNGIGACYNLIKGWITEDTTNIREMYIGHVTYKNFANIMMTTNMNNVLPLTEKDKQRYLIMCCVGGIKKKVGENFFNEYYKLLDNPSFLMCIVDYLQEKYEELIKSVDFNWQVIGKNLQTSAWEVYQQTFTPRPIKFLSWLMSGKIGWLNHFWGWKRNQYGEKEAVIQSYTYNKWEEGEEGKEGKFEPHTNTEPHPFAFDNNTWLLVPLNSRGDKKLGLYNLFQAWKKKFDGAGEGDYKSSSNWFSRQLDRLSNQGCDGLKKRKMSQIHYQVNPNRVWNWLVKKGHADNCGDYDQLADAPIYKNPDAFKFEGVCMIGDDDDDI
jgi:hypothetical protein